MSILTAAEQASPLVFTISSPGSGDGKSFLASHIAFAFAEAGFQTVLVDGDIRRGRLHQRFGLDRRPGLSDVLTGGVSLDEALRPTDYPELHVLPCGARVHHAPELLGGPGMSVVMAELRRRFQVVICDSPPLSAGIDPYVLAAATGRLMLVMRTGISHREMMGAKLHVLGRMPIDLLGVVMNDVPPDPSYGYYSYYLPGYETKDEASSDGMITVVT
jgi:capsular exopolysaccharide synthesis family protein